MAISGIERSPSGRAKCKQCGRIIGKGEPRGFELVRTNNYNSHIHYCYKCTPKIMDENMKSMKELKQEFEAEIKSCKKEIIAQELDNA